MRQPWHASYVKVVFRESRPNSWSLEGICSKEPSLTTRWDQLQGSRKPINRVNIESLDGVTGPNLLEPGVANKCLVSSACRARLSSSVGNRRCEHIVLRPILPSRKRSIVDMPSDF